MTPGEIKGLEELVDNGTTHVTIETPDGWACEREGCSIDYLHSHSTYSALLP
jgi:hypothetical protein